MHEKGIDGFFWIWIELDKVSAFPKQENEKVFEN